MGVFFTLGAENADLIGKGHELLRFLMLEFDDLIENHPWFAVWKPLIAASRPGTVKKDLREFRRGA